ncbi:MAG TPA: dienelactone hydrolase family protein [Cyclobacteriaceae bacterium]|nr:dienelactone hydrolase family protein [Cyclobacteriaceae bacterium]
MAHEKKVIQAGVELGNAEKVLIMLHGRGATARDILSLSEYLHVEDFCLLAPQATNHTWYPYRFIAPPQENEPWLSSALNLINEIVHDVKSAGISEENIYLLGFSQGACLCLEYAARNAANWAGVIAFTGGLIGDKIYTENYKGKFMGTKVFIGNSDVDPHVPEERSAASAKIIQGMGADVTYKVYKGMPHTINQDEIDTVNRLILKK